MPTQAKFEVVLSLKDKDAIVRGLESVGKEGQSAIKKIEQAAAPANKSLQALDSTSRGLQSQMGDLSSRAGVAGEALSALGKGGLAAAAGLGAMVAALGFAIRAAREAIDHFSKLNDQAGQLGLDVEALQQWTFGLSQIGVGAEQTTVAMTKLNDAVGQILIEGESAPKNIIESFSALGISIQDIVNTSGDLDAVLRLVADGMEHLGTQAEKTAVAKQLLGRSGAALIPIFNDGAAGIDKMKQSAQDAGAVLSRDLVKSLDDAGDRLSELNQIASVQSARSFGEFSSILVTTRESIIGVWTSINDLIEALRQHLGKNIADDIVSAFIPVIGTINLVSESYKSLKALIEKGINIVAPPEFTTGGGFGAAPTFAEAAGFSGIPSLRVRPEVPIKAAKAAKAPRAAKEPKLDFEISKPFEAEILKIDELSLSGLTETQKHAQASMDQIVEANLRAHGELVKLIEIRRDKELEALSVVALSEEDKAKARVLINDTAQQEINKLRVGPQEEPIELDFWQSLSKDLTEFGENLTSVQGITDGVIAGIASIGSTATSSFADAVVAGKDFQTTLESLTQTIEKMLIQLTLQLALQKALGAGATWLGGLIGGGGTAIGTGINIGGGGGGTGGLGGFQTEWMLSKGGQIQAALPHGIYYQPTVFPTTAPGLTPMARGMGLMAEAGPEAVLPLKKGPGGRLGVESIGAQKIQVIVNNNAGVDVQQSQRTGDDGSLQVILDIVRQDIAGQLSRPGTQINKALGLAANPVRAR
jgi:hypothetical protein